MKLWLLLLLLLAAPIAGAQTEDENLIKTTTETAGKIVRVDQNATRITALEGQLGDLERSTRYLDTRVRDLEREVDDLRRELRT